MRKLTEVWNDLETDERSLFEVVKTLAKPQSTEEVSVAAC